MAKQMQERKRHTEAKKEEESSTANTAVIEKRGERIKEDLDKLIDKIDETLQDNAEQFVKNYIQKGGE